MTCRGSPWSVYCTGFALPAEQPTDLGHFPNKATVRGLCSAPLALFVRFLESNVRARCACLSKPTFFSYGVKSPHLNASGFHLSPHHHTDTHTRVRTSFRL